MRKQCTLALASLLVLGSLSTVGCAKNVGEWSKEGVLRIASWDEYICMGGEDSYTGEGRPLYEEFEDWYRETYGKSIRVEYIPLQDNETMYSKIKMGDGYDLLCPSEYMMMKLAAEDKIQTLPTSFYDTNIEENYYAKYLSPYIRNVFEQGTLKNGNSWADYAAGYMWGSTGFVFNPEKIDPSVMTSWNAFQSEACSRKITAKDNVRDSYFIGLGVYYERQIADGTLSLTDFQNNRKTYMNDTKPDTMYAVKQDLIAMRKNLYGLETDEGKLEVINGRLDASFQWSGDGVYILDEAEANGILLAYAVPKLVSNLWFDGWSIMKGSKNVEAATAFINFLSMPENVIRNMYYIGYTSCIASDEIFEYVVDAYGDEESEVPYEYDLSYFFGAGHSLITAEEQRWRQLSAQYPEAETMERLVVMDYFDTKTNERANRMWINIK